MTRARFILSLFAVTLGLASCAVGPDFTPPQGPPDDHYTSGKDPAATVEAEGAAQSLSPGGELAADWWTLFRSPKLESIIKEAMANNPGLEAAQANLKQSQDNLRAGYGIFFPQADGDFSASRQRNSTLAFGSQLPSSIFNLFTLSATVSYTLDVFGGERRLVEELGAEADMQKAQERATWLALSSNIVNTAIARAAYVAEIEATRQLVDMEREQLRLSGAQEQAGTVPYSNVLSLQSQLALTEATLPPLEQKQTQTEDLLATLAGHRPAEWAVPDIRPGDLTLPKKLPVSLPSDLVHQRPDILAAEATLHAASADIGVATAALLPSFSLSGGYGTNSTTLGKLFAAAGRFWSFGGDVTTPIFHGGTLWFQRRAAIDAYNAAAATYRQTVLSAFAQVADSLRALEHDAEALKAQDAALAASERNLHLVTANYRAGLAAYTDLLIANSQYHQAVIGHLQASALRYQDTVALFAALGGGWWNEPPKPAAPAPDAASTPAPAPDGAAPVNKE